jgi:hypothetical protein
MNSSAPAPLPPVAALYHRPIEGTFHGGSLHFKGFVERLRSTLSVEVVAPLCFPGVESGPRGRNTGPLLVGFRYLLTSHWRAIRFLLSDGRRSRTGSIRAIIAFDIYLVWIAALWAKIRRIPLIYYPQDSNSTVSTHWREAGYRGGHLFRIVRAPLERLGLSVADLVLVVSDPILHELESEGVDARRLRLCPLKRSLPRFQSEAVDQWRRKLELEGKVPVVFVGSFEYAPNVRALQYVRTELAPRLADLDPRIVVLVAGVGSESFAASQGPNLRILGTVDDLDGLLFSSQIGIAPMDVAGGTSGKIIDYILHGLQTVATPEAARGVAAAPSLTVVPLAEFPGRIRALTARSPSPGALSAAPTIDESFRATYVDSEDIRSIGVEIGRLASRG